MSICKSYRKMCPDFIVNNFVTDVIKSVPLRVGFHTIRVTLKNDNLNDKTLSFCALTTLSVVCRKGCLLDIIDVVVKSAPKNEKLRTCIPVGKLFAREVFFYNTIMVELMDFQKNLNLKTEEMFLGVPALIAATLDEGKEALVLQCSPAEWSPRYEKWVGELTHEHIRAILKELARLHALSFAFNKTHSNRFDEFKKELQQGYFSTLENHHTLKIIHNILDLSLQFFSNDVVEKLKKFDNEIESCLENVLHESKGMQTLVHGDPTTNFLFCYEKLEVGGSNIVSRAKLVNWQLIKIGSAIFDLSLFLFTNCSGSFDDLNNIKQFLHFYHDYLISSLQEFHCDINEFLSYKSLEEDFKKFAKFGLALSFLNFQIMSLESSKRPIANNEDFALEEYLKCFVKIPNDHFVRRIKDLVKYCVNEEII